MLRSRGISQIYHTYSEDMHPVYPPSRCVYLLYACDIQYFVVASSLLSARASH